MSKEEIIEAVKGMSVLELNELVKAIEEEFGVTAAYNPEDPADPPPQAPVTDQSTVTTELAPASGVELEKSSQQTGEGAIGDTVTYTFTAINTGNVTLTDVALRDDMDGLRDLRYQWTTTGQFAPGEAVTETATYEITQADLDAGEVLNLAIIVGRRPGW